MRYKILPISNVARLSEASDALLYRPPGIPGMGLVHGPTGFGKTTAVTWQINQCNGIYARALAMWTPMSMLTSLLKELDAPLNGTCGDKIERVIEALGQTQRPLFIDEADYIIQSKRMTETLRDIHDMTAVPVILIGMHGIHRKLTSHHQLTGRLAQWVEFKPFDMVDARALADGLCEVDVEDDLLEQIHEHAAGEVRRITVALGQVENFARKKGIDKVGSVDWKGDFFMGAPVRKLRVA